jgi:serine/threonine protein kinase
MPAERAFVSSDCPDENLIGAYVEARLSSGDVARIEGHLDGCAACHRLAALIAGGGSIEMRSSVVASGAPAQRAGWLASGTQLGRYIVARPIGEGGMGVVYVAYDQDLRRDVALKVVVSAEDPPMGMRLVREAQVAARLQHPNVVSIYDVGEKDGVAFLTMELIRGRSLRACMRENDAPLPQKIGWLLDVARALAAAHRQGLVHRDIKPENVMVADDGVVKVVDFGIARPAQIDPASEANEGLITARGALIGTPVYMAPEQLRQGAIEPRTDQFAWGVLAYELLAGERPWKGNSYVLASAILTAELPAFPTHVPRALQAVVRKAVAKDPESRFSSMDEVIAGITSNDGVERRTGGHARTMLAGGAFTLLGAALAVAIVMSHRAKAHETPPPSDAVHESAVVTSPPVAPPALPARMEAVSSAPDETLLHANDESNPSSPRASKPARQAPSATALAPRATPSVNPFDIRK